MPQTYHNNSRTWKSLNHEMIAKFQKKYGQFALPVLKQTKLGRRAVGALASLRRRRRGLRESAIPGV
jgi:hypothetical protein